MRFSQRQGLVPIREILQKDGIDDATRNGLWNVLYLYRLTDGLGYKTASDYHPDNGRLAHAIWGLFFKVPVDTIPDRWDRVVSELRSFFLNCPWYEVYDLVEFIVKKSEADLARKMTTAANNLLSVELAGYRFVDGKIAPITSETEIAGIESALTDAKPFASVRIHLETAFALMADRESPDYRNSIKESISAVEAVVNIIAGTKRATLGSALKKLGIDVHPALNAAFDKMYGYTSDASGIRHALLDEPDLKFEDAKFMLVACSGFVSYLIAKASAAPSGAS